MATGVYTDLKIYEAEFYGAMVDTVAENLAAFGPNSGNAIRVIPGLEGGIYKKVSFFDDPITISRRNTASVAPQTATNMTEDENIWVGISRKANRVGMTIDSFMKKGLNEEAGLREFSRVLGVAFAKAKVKDYLQTALIAVEAAIEGNTAMNYDNTGKTNDHLTATAMAEGRALFGDRFGDIVTWVGHSRAYHDNQIDALSSGNLVANVLGTMINEGNVPTLGLPFVVTDLSPLIDSGSGSTAIYNVLGLVRDAVIVQETGPVRYRVWEEMGNENLEWNFQAEYDFKVGVKGFKWVTGSGTNPTDGTLGTTSNWTQVVADDKDTAGVRIKVDVNV